jgi:hypothetical protein
MIIADNALAGVTLINGTWQIQLSLLVMTIYILVAHSTIGLTNTTDDEVCTTARRNILFLHTGLLIILPVINHPNFNYIFLKYSLNTIGMICGVACTVLTGSCYMRIPKISESMTISTAANKIFFATELYSFLAIIVSHSLFLVLRSLFKHKIKPDD